MTVPNSRWDSVSFLHCDVRFSFVSDMRIKVTSVDVDIIGRIVVLLSQGLKKVFNFTFTRTYIHTSTVDWAHYQGLFNRPGYGLVRGPICSVRHTLLLNLQVGRISIQNCHATPMLVLFSSSFWHSCYCPDIPSAIYHFFWMERT